MNPLQLSLIEKAGHNCGFEYTFSEVTTSVTLGSARHSLHLEVSLDASGVYRVQLLNPEP